nr:hypothetical protein [Tanacetum cinerariifolium]
MTKIMTANEERSISLEQLQERPMKEPPPIRKEGMEMVLLEP